MMDIVFFDAEINAENRIILDLGAIDSNGRQFHDSSKEKFAKFVSGYRFIGGHNIVAHDLKYLDSTTVNIEKIMPVDTLCISPLLFPQKPYHRLLKDDKLISDELNNPLNDAIKSQELFYDEVNAFNSLPDELKGIYTALLGNHPSFRGFFKYVKASPLTGLKNSIKEYFDGKICSNANLKSIIKQNPVELAYSLAIINCDDRNSLTPAWVYRTYPEVENVLCLLRKNHCRQGCRYCNNAFDMKSRLKGLFGYDEFRTYDGEPLQENAVRAAVNGESLLAIFPTGGGKSLTFQLPAFIAGESSHGLTVVISPLQSLMKDQVDNLEKKGITDAVAINGLLNPIERADAIERVRSGAASLLYISPESLRSYTIENLLMSRHIDRFVIDEAHCFSTWGQDFRVDYLFIGDFIKQLQEKKRTQRPIPVSCFTATAKQKVISDIADYFRDKLGIELKIFASGSARTNLHYQVIYCDTDEKKYATLRGLVADRDCPAIVYVSKTGTAKQLADKLCADGIAAAPYHGKMDKDEKVQNQNAFMEDSVQVIVATSAFGMGVDKSDVGLVVHYEISASLEDYVQEAGRAGRNPEIKADCYILYNSNDLDSHFIMLNQTKMSMNEIQQVWSAIKRISKNKNSFTRSALEIAKEAGWDDNKTDVETRVKTAIQALENAGYIERGMNVPHIYADSILPRTMAQASEIIEGTCWSEEQKLTARRIVQTLISSRSKSKAGNNDGESRVDYIADNLGLTREQVIESIYLMRENRILSDKKDLTAYVKLTGAGKNKSEQELEPYMRLERYITENISGESKTVNLKEINSKAEDAGVSGTSTDRIRTILTYWKIKGLIDMKAVGSDVRYEVKYRVPVDVIRAEFELRSEILNFTVDWLYDIAKQDGAVSAGEAAAMFSLFDLKDAFNDRMSLFKDREASLRNVEDALLYLSRTHVINIEGGFLVLYNSMRINRIDMDNKTRYKSEDYRKFQNYYDLKIEQIHIVGEFANMMLKDAGAALEFIDNYFKLPYDRFIRKYFKGNKAKGLRRNITSPKYEKLFGSLSNIQREIIDDDKSQYIVVLAGPGSGKTRVLVHKMASLLLMEDVKHEQLLMLTFSRAAAVEFKQRLIELIGASSAHFVDIKTFHSYCFDLVGRMGSLEESGDIISKAVEMIKSGEAEQVRVTKTVLLIDEAQDMSSEEFQLVEALIDQNENMRIIAVGDDDQNIYGFRGADSRYFSTLVTKYGATKYEMNENYRSAPEIVKASNNFSHSLDNRLKTTDIKSMVKNRGCVRLVRHTSANTEIPLVENVKKNLNEGSTCILTGTNESALRVLGALIKEGVSARLIQSMDGFNLYNIQEMRSFINTISDSATPVISDDLWEEAENKVAQRYSTSTFLPVFKAILKKYDSVSKYRYKSDFVEFVKESQPEDFFEENEKSVTVSTLHKAKGKEFDNVYISLSDWSLENDESRRAVYVGMTRARKNLYIHCSDKSFENLAGLKPVIDREEYGEPDELVLHLSHRDVFLDYFKDKKDIIFKLRSGDILYQDKYDERYLCARMDGRLKRVIMLSKRQQEQLELLKQKGYAFRQAEIRYIVAWKSQNDDGEIPVILPEVLLKKSDENVVNE